MATPTYVVKKIGDNYVPVKQDDHADARRAAYVGGGALLALVGYRRGGLLGGVATLAGAGLIARGALGFNPMIALRVAPGHAPDGLPTETPSYQNDYERRASQVPADLVDEESMESFPASDPPARTGIDLTRHQ